MGSSSTPLLPCLSTTTPSSSSSSSRCNTAATNIRSRSTCIPSCFRCSNDHGGNDNRRGRGRDDGNDRRSGGGGGGGTAICFRNSNKRSSNDNNRDNEDGRRSSTTATCSSSSNNSSQQGSSSNCNLIGSLIALAYIQFVDSISVMVVLPSLVFYVKEVGGTIDDYGIILSFFSLSSVISKPILGMWVDSRPLGIKYKIPYYVSIIIGGIVGGLIYFAADCISYHEPGDGIDSDDDDDYFYKHYFDVDRSNDDYHYHDPNDTTTNDGGMTATANVEEPTGMTFTSSIPVMLILIGRLLGGFGQANETLRDAYLSVMIPSQNFTTIFSLLNLTRVIGLAAAPGFQVLLDRIYWKWKLSGGYSMHVTSLNSVGLFMAVINFIALLAVWVLLEEPTKDNMVVSIETEGDEGDGGSGSGGGGGSVEDDQDEVEDGGGDDAGCNPNDNMRDDHDQVDDVTINYGAATTTRTKTRSDSDDTTGSDTSSSSNTEKKTDRRLRNERKSLSIMDSVFQIEIILPMMTALFINSSFHLIETAFAPAVNDALGWGPVECSAVLGSMSILILFSMIIIIALNKRKVSDEILCGVGCIIWCIGSLLIYYLWRNLPGGSSRPWQFVIGVLICIFGFPFTSTCRSLYTKAVSEYPTLVPIMGTMQSMISLMPSIAGFITPSIVASFILRSPQEVMESKHHRELSPLALCVPISTVVLLIGLVIQQRKYNWQHKLPQSQRNRAKSISVDTVKTDNETDDDRNVRETTALLA